MGDAAWYAKPGFISEANARLAAIELEHHAAFERWEELDGRPQ
jgi:hypothetical protein